MSFPKNSKLFIGRGVLDMEEDQIDVTDVALTIEINGEAIDQFDIQESFLLEWPLEENNLDDLIVLRAATNGNPEDLYFCKIEDTLERIQEDTGKHVRTYWLSFSRSETLGTAKSFEDIHLSTSVNRMSIFVHISDSDDETKAEMAAATGNVSENSGSSRGSSVSQTRRNSFQHLHEDLKAPQLDASKITPEEVKSLMPQHIPSWLRVDMDIKHGLVNLNTATRQYTEMDIKFLKQDAERKMDQEFTKSSVEYDAHKRGIDKQVADSKQKVDECLQLKDNVIKVGQEKFENVKKIVDFSSDFITKNAEFEKMSLQEREQIVQINGNLRISHNNVAVCEIEGERLKIVQETEQKLFEEQTELLKQSVDIVKNDLLDEQQTNQRLQDRAQQDLEAFDQAQENVNNYRNQCQERYQDFYVSLEDNIAVQKQQSDECAADLQKIVSENTELKLETEKYIKDIESYESNLVSLKQKEDVMEKEWNETIQDMKLKVQNCHEEIRLTLEDLKVQKTDQSEFTAKNMTISIQIKLAQETANLFESARFQEKIEEINRMTEEHNVKTDELQQELKEVSETWLAFYETAISELEDKLSEASNRPVLEFIEESMAEIQEYDQGIQDISREIQELEQEIAADNHTDEELQEAKLRAQKKLIEFRTMLNKKTVLYSELFTNTVQLVDKDDEIIQIEKEAMKLRTDIDIGRLEIKQKTKLADELQQSLNEKKVVYKQLKADIAALDQRAEELEAAIQEIEEELEIHEELHNQKDIELGQLEKLTGEKAPQFDTGQILQEKVNENNQAYKAIRGDIVDELLAKYINETDCKVPTARLGDGYYVFGTKKIYAKVNNGRLVVRVGGGYMDFREFIETSSNAELIKIKDLVDDDRWDMEELVAYHKNKTGGPNPTMGRRNSSFGRAASPKRQGSPLNGSPRGSINGGSPRSTNQARQR